MSNKLNYSVSEVNDLLRKLENDVALQTDLNELKKEIEGGVLKPEDAEKTYATKESVSDINKVLYGDDTQSGIPVSNNDFVENIYVNKNLSPDQVDAILNAVSTEAWIEMGETEKLLFIVSNQNATKVLSVICFILDGVPQGFVIMSLAEQLIYYVSPSISDMLGDDFGGVSGWNPEAPSIIEWNDEAVKNTAVEGLNITVGEYNDELVEIFSLNNIFSAPEGIVLETEKLSRTVYGKTFESTPVIINAPNPINLYFNTTMDSDTVEQLCNQLLEKTGQHRYFITVGKMAEMAGGNIAIFYQDNEQPSTDPTWSGDTHGQMIGFAAFKDDNNTVIAEADIFSIWKPGDGWDPVHIFNNLAAPFSFIETTVDVPGYEVGKYNELIKDVVSSSAFRENIVGLEEQVQELNEDVDKIEESLGDISSLLDEINGSGTLPPDILIANCEVGDIDSGTSYYFSSDIDIREIYKYSNIDLVATVNDGTNVSSITLPMQSFAKVVSSGLTHYQLQYDLTVLSESYTECILGTALNSDGEVWFSAVNMGVPKESMSTTKFQLKAYNVGKVSSSGGGSNNKSILEWDLPMQIFIGMTLGSLTETTDTLPEDMVSTLKNNTYDIIKSKKDLGGGNVPSMNLYLDMKTSSPEQNVLEYHATSLSSGVEVFSILIDLTNKTITGNVIKRGSNGSSENKYLHSITLFRNVNNVKLRVAFNYISPTEIITTSTDANTKWNAIWNDMNTHISSKVIPATGVYQSSDTSTFTMIITAYATINGLETECVNLPTFTATLYRISKTASMDTVNIYSTKL